MKVANSLGFKTNHTLESPRELVLTNTVFPHLTKIEVVIRFTHPPQIEMNPEKNIKSNGFRHWRTLISERRNSDKDEPLIVLACYPEAVSRPQCKAVELKQSSEVSLCREDRGQSFGRPWRRGRLQRKTEDRGLEICRRAPSSLGGLVCTCLWRNCLCLEKEWEESRQKNSWK